MQQTILQSNMEKSLEGRVQRMFENGSAN